MKRNKKTDGPLPKGKGSSVWLFVIFALRNNAHGQAGQPLYRTDRGTGLL